MKQRKVPVYASTYRGYVLIGYRVLRDGKVFIGGRRVSVEYIHGICGYVAHC